MLCFKALPWTSSSSKVEQLSNIYVKKAHSPIELSSLRTLRRTSELCSPNPGPGFWAAGKPYKNILIIFLRTLRLNNYCLR